MSMDEYLQNSERFRKKTQQSTNLRVKYLQTVVGCMLKEPSWRVQTAKSSVTEIKTKTLETTEWIKKNHIESSST